MTGFVKVATEGALVVGVGDVSGLDALGDAVPVATGLGSADGDLVVDGCPAPGVQPVLTSRKALSATADCHRTVTNL